MFKNQLWVFLLITIPPFSFAADAIPGNAVEMNTTRINNLLFRFTRFNAESSFPCLRLESIDPLNNWEIVEQKDLCEIDGISLDNDLTYAAIEALEFHQSSLHFNLTYFDNQSPGEYLKECSVDFNKGNIQEPKCLKAALIE